MRLTKSFVYVTQGMKVDQIVYGAGCVVTAVGLASAIFMMFFLDDMFANDDVPLGAVRAQCYILKQPISEVGGVERKARFPYEVLLDASHPEKMRKTVASLLGPVPADGFRQLVNKEVPCWVSDSGDLTIVAAEAIGRQYFNFYFVCCMCCIPCCCTMGSYMLFSGITGHTSSFMSAWRCDVPHPKTNHDPQHDRLV
jgi:hypothetical protein